MPESPEIVFLVPGRSGGESNNGLLVEASARGGAEAKVVPVPARPGADVVRLELVNGPELILHPENARDLLLAQRGGPSRSGSAGTKGAGVAVPTRLDWLGAEVMARERGGREGAGQVVLHAFEVIKDVVGSKGMNLVAGAAADLVDGLVRPGLHRLTAATPALTGEPLDLGAEQPAGPVLVLVHGTFTSTAGSFKRLWDEHTDLVEALLRAFDQRVYAFEHPTLRVSPLDNALALARVLPRGVPIHFLTHSRGGLVVEALAQAAGRTLDDAEIAAFDGPGAKGAPAEAYEQQRQRLRELGSAARGLDVRRVVRVACPARGTLLASNRLDAYLSVLKWGLTLAQLPVAPQLVDLLRAIAKRRTRPDELPGLEAMMPESPFLKWVHRSSRPIPGELRVVAGDLQGDSIGSWVKTLLADAFYWTDNDLVVQTRSMYGGGARAGGAAYFLDRGGKVTHFNYFSNRKTADAVVRALDPRIARPDGFKPIGVESSQGLSSTGSRGELTAAGSRSAARPAVILLPGILGSHLRQDGDRVWLSPLILNGLPRLEYRQPDGVAPDGVLGVYYDGLAESLAESHEVILFPFDWRKPIEEEARRLGAVVEQALDARKDGGQPVRLLAHSMGGLVARALELEAPKVWERLMGQPDGRLVFLGTPHGGSWAPMQVLSGDDLVGGLVAFAGTLFDVARSRAIFAGLPGFMQLQAGLLDPAKKLRQRDAWVALAGKDLALWRLDLPWHDLEIQKRAPDWGIPEQHVLDAAAAFQERLAGQDLSRHGKKVVMVVGHARRTPSGFEQDGRFEYLQSDAGDGTVTLSSALLPGVAAWQVEAEHGQLPKHRDLHGGYAELLARGSTGHQLFRPLGLSRGAASLAPGASSERMPRVARLRGWTDAALEETLGTLTPPADSDGSAATAAASPAIRVSVMNGDLTFVKEPILIGHYRSLALTGAEAVMDRFLGGTMSEALRLRRYPSRTEESEVFDNVPNPDNPMAVPTPAAVVVVGLGPEGELRAEELSRSVRQGVIGYAQRRAQDPQASSSFELAATLVGSGGLGVTVAMSARAVAHGVRAANEALLKEGWPIVSRLRFIELYEDRATDALGELMAAAERLPAAFIIDSKLEAGDRALPRPATAGYRGANYDYVSAVDGPLEDGRATIAFAVDTRRARTEVRSSSTQLGLLRSLIQDAEADRRSDIKLGKTLFRVLVPAELDSFFGDSEAVVLEVDDATASIPWEILGVDHEDEQPNDRPWAVRTKLLRKLRSKHFRENPHPAGREADVLVFGDPACDRAVYPVLEGARREARAVAQVLGLDAPLVEPDARAMVKALLDRPYSVVHIAGHGRADGGGVVMSGDQVLGAELVATMRRVPDLVFVNCCHSARQLVGADPGGRPERAATIASALIRIGVRCVIATGWAVDDDAAERFAHEFYERLWAGRSFITATSEAREIIWREFAGSNTWAAYQCYGDPDWRYRDPGMAVARPSASGRKAPEPLIASPSALVVALRGEAARGRQNGAAGQSALKRLQELARAHGPGMGKLGEVAEAFAAAFSDVGDQDQAIEWYGNAVRAEKAGASYRSLEQLSNLVIRRAAERVSEAYVRWAGDRDTRAFDAVVSAARADVDRAEGDLKLLRSLNESYERLNLLASACKRRALIEQMVQMVPDTSVSKQAWLPAVEETVKAFAAAAQRARDQKRDDVHYPRLNQLTAELVLHLEDPSRPLDADGVAEVQASLATRRAIDPGFWVLVQEQELAIYQALCQRRLAEVSRAVASELERIHGRIGSRREWSSVRDQARFSLLPYRGAAGETERRAADDLTRLLEDYARGATA